MKNNRTIFIVIGVFVLLAGVLFTVFGKRLVGNTSETVIIPESPQTLDTVVVEQSTTEVSVPSAVPTESEMDVPALREGLEATDPGSVVLASGEMQFVEIFDFYWSDCQAMAPIVHGLEVEYFDAITFSYLDIADNGNVGFLSSLGYRGTPHFFLLDGEGTIREQWVGPVSEADLRNAFDSHMQ